MESGRVDRDRAEAWRNAVAEWERPPTHRYAVFLFGRQVTPWRMSSAAAVVDAFAEGHMTRDEYGQAFSWVGVDIVSRRL